MAIKGPSCLQCCERGGEAKDLPRLWTSTWTGSRATFFRRLRIMSYVAFSSTFLIIKLPSHDFFNGNDLHCQLILSYQAVEVGTFEQP